MKRCPECGRTYPDSEHYCATDGVALVAADGSGEARTTQQIESVPPPAGIECPVCGGKALPGETVCSFCGARLDAAQTGSAPASAPQAPAWSAGPATRLNQSFDDEPGTSAGNDSASGSVLAWLGYILAALLAVLAGAWFAWHLSGGGKRLALGPSPSATVSPAAANEPAAALAAYTPVTVSGESFADPARNVDAVTKVFNANRKTLLDVYRNELANDSTLHDGMLVELTVTPDGSVVAGAVKTSTAPNPALDSEAIKTMMGWQFAPFAGSAVKVNYPVVLARNAAERSTVDSALAAKVASLSPGGSPEYASAGAAPAASVAAASPSAQPSPALAAAEPIAPPAPPKPLAAPEHVAPRPERHRFALARPRTPKPTLLQRVQARLRADRRFNRVKAYTSNGSVVTIYGTVYNDKNRQAAVRAVKSVAGVTDVIDTLQTDTGLWAQQEQRVVRELQNAGLNKVTVQIIGHDAYLDGEVSTPLQRERAETIAESAAPVKVRTNLIRVVPRGVFGF